MRINPRLLATAANIGGPDIFKGTPLALLPPIPLYRRLLRAHRKRLPPEERALGDAYVKDEFRRHRNIENPLHIVGFLTEWQAYAQQIEGDNWSGKKLDPAKLERMNDQQVTQLYELMQAIRKKDLDDSEK